MSDVDDWLAADAAARSSISNKILLVVLGLGGLYALIGVVNSVVIGAAARRREFAEARVDRDDPRPGGPLGAAGVVRGDGRRAGAGRPGGRRHLHRGAATTAAVTGSATLDLPWTVIALGIAALVLVVTSVTSVITSWSATRPRTGRAARRARVTHRGR